MFIKTYPSYSKCKVAEFHKPIADWRLVYARWQHKFYTIK